jgi:hypothetical protein
VRNPSVGRTEEEWQLGVEMTRPMHFREQSVGRRARLQGRLLQEGARKPAFLREHELRIAPTISESERPCDVVTRGRAIPGWSDARYQRFHD